MADLSDPERLEDLLSPLVSEEGANGRMRAAIRYNERIADEAREAVAMAGLDEHEARIRRRVQAHVHLANGLAELSWPVVIQLCYLLPWPERARMAFVLLWPTGLRLGRANQSADQPRSR